MEAAQLEWPARRVIDPSGVQIDLERAAAFGPGRVREVLAKARSLVGLEPVEAAALLCCQDPGFEAEIFEAAREVKRAIYGDRLVLFAPLYVSNLCRNECSYCAFKASNRTVVRKALTAQGIDREVTALLATGHKRLLLVAGEGPGHRGLDYVIESIQAAYATRCGPDRIRRINVNIAPLKVEEFHRLRAVEIGTYQLFQETYHQPTYERVHQAGPKADYRWRLSAIDRAMQAGIDDVGIGVLFGLADHHFEVVALLHHVRHLERRFGVGPHTISVPRMEPASGSPLASHPPHPLGDADFKRVVAVLRLAVPYTGIIMSTRETSTMRTATLSLGVSQISAGSRTNPGGYAVDAEAGAQFQLGDHRPLEEVISDVVSQGYLPSFCTACYRLGRTGRDFMDLAKPGLIRNFCQPNALLTFREYLTDHASPETVRLGREFIERQLELIPQGPRRVATEERMLRIDAGEHDLYF